MEKVENTKEENEAIKKLLLETQDLTDEALLEEAILNNQLEFEIKDVKYRIRKPSFKEKQEVYSLKAKKFAELIKDKNFMLEKDLRRVYKERGIDIEEMETRFKNLEKDKNNLQFKLGEALVNKATDDEMKSLREEILKIRDLQIEISVEKTSLLDYTIEQQLFTFCYSYLLYLIGEKLVDDKWVKAWNKYEDFENEDDQTVKTFAYYGALIVKEEIR